jgi:hypothetical protein
LETPVVVGVVLRTSIPATATPLTPRDIASIRGVTLEHAASFTWGDAERADIACASASDAWWVGGLEGAVLDAASALVRSQLDLAAITPRAIERDGHGYRQSYRAEAIRGAHVLGFHDGRVLLCTVSSTTEIDVALQGASSAEPEGALSVALRHPSACIALGSALVLLAAAWILRRRPRPAW